MTPVSGCFVQTRSRGQSQAVSRDCPPSTHWEDGQCVHNGNGHGNGKHKDKHKGKGHK